MPFSIEVCSGSISDALYHLNFSISIFRIRLLISVFRYKVHACGATAWWRSSDTSREKHLFVLMYHKFCVILYCLKKGLHSPIWEFGKSLIFLVPCARLNIHRGPFSIFFFLFFEVQRIIRAYGAAAWWRSSDAPMQRFGVQVWRALRPRVFHLVGTCLWHVEYRCHHLQHRKAMSLRFA